jgi:hypothetical protein
MLPPGRAAPWNVHGPSSAGAFQMPMRLPVAKRNHAPSVRWIRPGSWVQQSPEQAPGAGWASVPAAQTAAAAKTVFRMFETNMAV